MPSIEEILEPVLDVYGGDHIHYRSAITLIEGMADLDKVRLALALLESTRIKRASDLQAMEEMVTYYETLNGR